MFENGKNGFKGFTSYKINENDCLSINVCIISYYISYYSDRELTGGG